MKHGPWTILALSCAFGAVALAQPAADAPITANPIPAPVEKRGLAVAIADVARLPDTRAVISAELDVAPRGTARVSFVHDAPDGRRYANDQRGFIYRLETGEEPALWHDTRDEFPLTNYSRVESGLIAFEFHPEFPENGLFYTVHVEYAANNPAELDFIPPGYRPADVTYHNVITEWHADDPEAPMFSGTHRVLDRKSTRLNSSH